MEVRFYDDECDHTKKCEGKIARFSSLVPIENINTAEILELVFKYLARKAIPSIQSFLE